MSVLSLVAARIAAERRAEVVEPFRRALENGPPPGIRETFLLVGEDDELAIATLWESREALDAMRASGEEPFARRLLREAGGEPTVRFFDVEVDGRR